MGTKTTFLATKELAEMAAKNAEQVFSSRGKVLESRVVGNDDFGYSIAVTMLNLVQANKDAIPAMIDGVPVHVVIKGEQSPAYKFCLQLNRDV